MPVHVLAGAASVIVLAFVLWDAFETVILPRTVTRRLRLSRLYYGGAWNGWAWIASRFRSDTRRERFLAVFGPLALVALAGVWAAGLVFGFGGLQWAIGSHLHPLGPRPVFDDLYMSATTFFTLGLGDVLPSGREARLVTAAEAGTGFAFLATVISYFPVLYQSFSRRETQLTLLDAWAGSPPAGVEVLRRLAARGELDLLQPFLKDWEDLVLRSARESHLLSGAGVFPLAASAAVVDRRARSDSGCRRAGGSRHRWCAHVAGTRDVCYRPPRRRGPDTGPARDA